MQWHWEGGLTLCADHYEKTQLPWRGCRHESSALNKQGIVPVPIVALRTGQAGARAYLEEGLSTLLPVDLAPGIDCSGVVPLSTRLHIAQRSAHPSASLRGAL